MRRLVRLVVFGLLFLAAMAARGNQIAPASPPPLGIVSPAPDAAAAGRTRGLVVRVVDGDTIRFRLEGATKDEPLRLIGVDTPETHHPSVPVECYGPEAEAFTRSQLEGRTVDVEFGARLRDRYGRLLGYVWLGSGTPEADLFNARLIEDGYASMLFLSPHGPYEGLLSERQASAQRRGAGMWEACAA